MTRERAYDEDEGNRHALTPSRRRFLQATGVAGIAGATGIALGQQGATTFEFGAQVSGWQGQAPAAIEGETNPTITLQAGTEYEVVWENLDGLPHDFVIQDADGNELVGTDIVSEEGATVTLSFTATEEMARYICTVHPNSMVGDIEIGTDDGEATPTPTETPAQVAGYVPEGPSVGATLVADGPLVNPVTLRTVPGTDDTHLVVDQAGIVYVLEDGELRDEPFLDVSEDIAFLDGREGGFDERGLLGMDLHPDFQENGRFYVRYSSLEPVSEGDALVGPGDRQLPEDWDHVEVLSEFQTADAGEADQQNGTATPTDSGRVIHTGTTETGTPGETGSPTGTPADDGQQLQADPESERVLLEVPEPQFNHNGGEVAFGPDGYLYTSLGDGGAANDVGLGHVEDWYADNEGGNAQDVTENLLGSILRVDVDSEGEGTPYAIPEDNPLVDTDGFDEQYAWGLRNPWRMSFNDGTLITADVGQALFEEVDVVENGANYGWNVREGFHCFNAADATSVPAECPTTAPEEAPFDGQPLSDPMLEYPHNYEGAPVGISITGGYVYGGGQVSDLSDQYVFGDWSTNFAVPNGRVFVATMGDDGATATPETEMAGTATGTPTDGGTETATAGGGEGPETDTATPTEGGDTATPTEDGDTATPTPTEGATGTEEPTPVPVEQQVDIQLPDEQPWPYAEVLFENSPNGRLNRFVQAFGRDDDGNVYVLASRTGRLLSEAGEVWQIVPPGEGDEIAQPATETPTPTENGDTATPTENGTITPGGDLDASVTFPSCTSFTVDAESYGAVFAALADGSVAAFEEGYSGENTFETEAPINSVEVYGEAGQFSAPNPDASECRDEAGM